MPSPPFHYQAVHDLGAFARNALAAPRGTAKSKVIGTEVPLMLAILRPHFQISLALASDKLVEERFDIIMPQISDNPQILEDFGTLRPRRGEAIWNRHHLHLRNGSTIGGMSVMGKKRGARPILFILDDPEFDPESASQTAAVALLEKFEQIMFRQIVPMLKHGCSIFWVGTMINKKSFLYHACTSDDDKRFQFWNRRVLTAIDKRDGQKTQLLWKELWPEEVLDARRDEIGASAFAAEYENNPSSDEERILSIDPVLNEYTVQGDDIYEQAPLASDAPTSWNVFDKEGDISHHSKPFSELVGSLYRILAFDYAPGSSVYGDYSCAAIMGFDSLNTLWLLDLWLGRAKEAKLLDVIFKMGDKWKVKVLGIEAESIQIAFADSVLEHVNTRVEREGSMWRPHVKPVRYPKRGMDSKGQRIAAMEWRYKRGKIKYPRHLKSKWEWAQLYAQTHDFTADLALLRYDDAIDTIAMNQYIIHSRGQKFEMEKPPSTLADRIRNNDPLVKGMPVLGPQDLQKLNTESIIALMDKTYKSGYNTETRRRVLGNRAQRPRRTYR